MLVLNVPLRRLPDVPRERCNTQVWRIARRSPQLERCIARPAHRIKQHVEIAHVVKVQVGQEELIEQGGFKIRALDMMYIQGTKFASFNYWGTAVPELKIED